MKPRIRISSKAYQDRLKPKHAATPRASFNVRQRLRKATRQRQRRKALILTLILHLIGLFWLVQQIKPAAQIDDVIHIDFVELPREKRATIKVKPREIKSTVTTQPTVNEFRQASTTAKVRTDAARFKAPEAMDVDLEIDDTLPSETLTTAAKLKPTGTITAGNRGASHDIGRGITSRAGGNAGRSSGFDTFRGKGKGSGTGEDEPSAPDADLIAKVEDNQLGAVLEGTPQEPSGHIRIIRLKHSLSDWWQDPTAIPSFAKWLQEHTQLRADMTFAGGSLPLTDDRILSAPLMIMTGHDKDITVGRNLNKDGPLSEGFTSQERAQLRKYIVEREGMLFFDDCGFNGNFAALVQNELQRTFPGYPLNNIDHTHELYTIYYQLPRPPRGGDVFWGNLNKGDSGGYFATESQFRFQKGITINRRLAVLFNRKDYLCSMETAEVGSRALLRMRRSTDVHRFMTNLLIYTMRYGGNTDRSRFAR